jgi:predicted Zn-dependent protease
MIAKPFNRRMFLGGVAAAALSAGAGCSTNPVTGRSQLILVDDSALQQAALQAWDQQVRQQPAWNNPLAQTRLQRVGMAIVTAAGRGNQPWEFRLFDSDEKNAFVLPANKVGFYRGLYQICSFDDYIACVLGHETGHVLGRHAAERYSREMATQTVLQVAGSVANNQIAAAALGLGTQVGVSLPFSREQEAEADLIGIDLMHTAGYDVKQAIPFWRLMATSGGSRPPELLSTHPDPDNRIARIRDHINQRGWGPV